MQTQYDIRSIFVFIIFIGLLYSCGNNKNKFEETTIEISGESIDVDFFVGSPAHMECNDSLLLFYDRYEKKTMTVFDLKNRLSLGRFLSEGKGPGEVMVPLKISIDRQNTVLLAFQEQSGFLSLYDISDIKAKGVMYMSNIRFEDRPANLKQLSDGFVGIGPFNMGRFHIYDSTGTLVKEVGDYPYGGNDMEKLKRFFLYQGHLCSNPKENIFVLGSSNCDNLEFYKVTPHEIILLKKYETVDVSANFGGGKLNLNDDCLLGYKCAYGGEKYCYMLYSGKTFIENNRSRNWARKIRVYTWDGNYVKTYVADTDLSFFCVDEQHNILYGIAKDEDKEMAMKQFKL